ncbi:MAG: ABC transporter permease subunit, partial [Anaerolineae bacterium]|nr:ABC transporter permease subunit [Anaerolineae bacterium]
MARFQAFFSYARSHPSLAAGLIMLLLIFLFGLLGPLFVDIKTARPISAPPMRPPSAELPFGTDDSGRNLLAVMVLAVPRALQLGLMAGVIGVGIGIILGFLAGYLGGAVDAVIRGAVDILLTVPGLVILVTIAATLRESISVEIMALIIALLAWMGPTRAIRSQVLSMRERAYIRMAKLNGMSTPEIIVKELIPNLLPYLGAIFVGAVAGGLLAAVGLEALGLGPQNDP